MGSKRMKRPITSVTLPPSVLRELSLPLHIQNAVAFKLSVSLGTRVITLEQRGSMLSAPTASYWLFIKAEDSEKPSILWGVFFLFMFSPASLKTEG